MTDPTALPIDRPHPAGCRGVPGTRPTARQGEFRTPVARAWRLGAATVLLLATTAGSAGAACVCRCVDGAAKPVCSSSTDIPPLCNTTVCPMSPPKVSPLDQAKPKPEVKPGCTIRQVYNPETGRYDWGQICH